MMIHISLGGIVTIHMEGAWAYGFYPSWKISRFRREIVLDMPFSRVIITPGTIYASLPEKEPCFCDRVGRIGWNCDERKRPWDIDQPSAGVAED